MSKFAIAILVNLFLPGIGTIIAGRLITGIIQTLISILCFLGIFGTLGFGLLLFGPIEFLNWLWAVVGAVLMLDNKRTNAMGY